MKLSEYSTEIFITHCVYRCVYVYFYSSVSIHTESPLLMRFYKWSHPEDISKKGLVQNCSLINPRPSLCYQECLFVYAITVYHFNLLLPDRNFPSNPLPFPGLSTLPNEAISLQIPFLTEPTYLPNIIPNILVSLAFIILSNNICYRQLNCLLKYALCGLVALLILPSQATVMQLISDPICTDVPPVMSLCLHLLPQPGK